MPFDAFPPRSPERYGTLKATAVFRKASKGEGNSEIYSPPEIRPTPIVATKVPNVDYAGRPMSIDLRPEPHSRRDNPRTCAPSATVGWPCRPQRNSGRPSSTGQGVRRAGRI